MNEQVKAAFEFAKSVMQSQGVYRPPFTPEHALQQLLRNPVDLSERMAIEKLQKAGVDSNVEQMFKGIDEIDQATVLFMIKGDKVASIDYDANSMFMDADRFGQFEEWACDFDDMPDRFSEVELVWTRKIT